MANRGFGFDEWNVLESSSAQTRRTSCTPARLGDSNRQIISDVSWLVLFIHPNKKIAFRLERDFFWWQGSRELNSGLPFWRRSVYHLAYSPIGFFLNKERAAVTAIQRAIRCSERMMIGTNDRFPTVLAEWTRLEGHWHLNSPSQNLRELF